ncbi:MAG: hypothetical protein MUD06_06345 [Rhodospirillales bacterium]|jgi:hypothetical protein|nr:hypothetical protein [Rhodospirillales bacterium]
MNSLDRLLDIVRAESAAPVPERVAAIADAARARHGNGVAAVLAYGSALRERDDAAKMVDLYLLVDGYGEAGQGRWLGLANRLLPPNVYYLETDHAGARVRSKYAMVSLGQLETLVGPGTVHPYFWARFAQPTALVWARDEETAERVRRTLAQAILTLIGEAWRLTQPEDPPEARWVRAFSETYRTELRAEEPERARQLYCAHAGRYEAIAAALGPEANSGLTCATALRRWRKRRILGKALSVLRLLKAAFTFHDGAAYLASKIEQHSGVPVALTDWQRRHPVLASPGLAWRLYRRGAFR